MTPSRPRLELKSRSAWRRRTARALVLVAVAVLGSLIPRVGRHASVRREHSARGNAAQFSANRNFDRNATPTDSPHDTPMDHAALFTLSAGFASSALR
jgi:hypothetical protein